MAAAEVTPFTQRSTATYNGHQQLDFRAGIKAVELYDEVPLVQAARKCTADSSARKVGKFQSFSNDFARFVALFSTDCGLPVGNADLKVEDRLEPFGRQNSRAGTQRVTGPPEISVNLNFTAALKST